MDFEDNLSSLELKLRQFTKNIDSILLSSTETPRHHRLHHQHGQIENDDINNTSKIDE